MNIEFQKVNCEEFFIEFIHDIWVHFSETLKCPKIALGLPTQMKSSEKKISEDSFNIPQKTTYVTNIQREKFHLKQVELSSSH